MSHFIKLSIYLTLINFACIPLLGMRSNTVPGHPDIELQQTRDPGNGCHQPAQIITLIQQPHGKTVGHIEFELPTPSCSTGFIRDLFIVKEYRNRRIGSELLEICCNQLEQAGCLAIALDAVPDRDVPLDKLVTFYKRANFHTIEKDIFAGLQARQMRRECVHNIEQMVAFYKELPFFASEVA